MKHTTLNCLFAKQTVKNIDIGLGARANYNGIEYHLNEIDGNEINKKIGAYKDNAGMHIIILSCGVELSKLSGAKFLKTFKDVTNNLEIINDELSKVSKSAIKKYSDIYERLMNGEDVFEEV